MTKGKGRKNSGQSPKQPLSPTTSSDKTDATVTATTSAMKSSPAPHLPSEPPQSQPPYLAPHDPMATVKHVSTVAWSLVQSLPGDLHLFLEADLEANYSKITKLQYYRILLHFDPATKSRMSHNKDVLTAAFQKHVLPLLVPFMKPRPSTPMETDQDPKSQLDFNPLGRKTTRKMLMEAIKRKAPHVPIPPAARRDGLVLLYQAHVDKDLVIPGQTEFIKKPHYLKPNAVADEDMEDLRLSLQCHAPNVFIHSAPMTHQVLVDCYLHFLLEEPINPGALIRGFHYSIIS